MFSRCQATCVLLADPVVESLNAMSRDQRIQCSLDMVEAGDAVLAVTEAYRINNETLGNAEPALHTHIIPRCRHEPDDKRRRPAWVGYDWPTSRRFDPVAKRAFVEGVLMRLTNNAVAGA